MTEKIFRNYLEIKNQDDLREVDKPSASYSVKLANPNDFQLNKFFYKNIGRNYQWVDRLVWTDLNWVDYVSNKNLFTYILKDQNEIAGYFELLLNQSNKEAEAKIAGITPA